MRTGTMEINRNKSSVFVPFALAYEEKTWYNIMSQGLTVL